MKESLNKQCQVIADRLILRLKLHGINAYIWHKATTGSIYIRFENNQMGSIRIGDHDGREHLRYKWNIRTDVPQGTSQWRKDNGVWRYYIHFHKWNDLIPLLEDRANKIGGWGESKYQYTIPYFKQKE